MRIFEQAKADLYIVDFEKPNVENRQVNAWRQIFVANEYSELQVSMRYVDPETLLIWFIFFWIGLGWSHCCESDPNFSVIDNPLQVPNLFLKFFLVGFILLCIGAGIFISQSVFDYVNASKLNTFVDLCTLANTSLVLIEEYTYGYYLHAKAPWGSSDIPLDWLQNEIQQESNGNSQSRSLKNKNKSAKDKFAVQSYQMYIPTQMRKELI